MGRGLAFVLDLDDGVIVEVGAYSGQFFYDGDVEALEKTRWSYAAQLEDLRRVDGACSEDDFLVRRDGRLVYRGLC